jgi:DNA-binding SARP family transcriptional activator
VVAQHAADPAPIVPASGRPQLRIRLLGPLEVLVDGHPLRFSRLERALLRTLALDRGRVVSVDRIVDSLWPHDPPGSARGRVQALVSGVRRRLGPAVAPVLRTESSGYRLDLEAGQVDAAEFEALAAAGRADAAAGRLADAADTLRRALALWPAPATDLSDVGAGSAYGQRLADVRLLVLEDCADLELRLRPGTDLTADLRLAVAGHPARERLRALLMRALHADGRTAEALEVYREAFRFYRDELGIEPGEQLRRTQLDLLGGPDGIEPAPAPRPDQLPPDLATLVGRDAVLARLTATVARLPRPRAAPAVIAISGMAGVGKTALAVRLGHTVRRRFATGCLYADLRGYDGTPADPADVAGWFLRALGCPPGAVPGDAQARYALLRSMTADRPVLVVLDNARDEAQVRPLLPASGAAAVVITSRRSLLGLDGAELVRLDVLPLSDSVALLTALAGAALAGADGAGSDRAGSDRAGSGGAGSGGAGSGRTGSDGAGCGEVPAATERVAALCGGLPLALRIAGVRLAAGDELPALADRLADEHRRLAHLTLADVGLRPSLDLGYRQLSADARRLLRRLGSAGSPDLPGWLPDVLLAAPADVAVEELVDAQFVDPGWWPRRIRLHDLVWIYARDRLEAEEPPADRDALARRTYQVLLHAAERAAAELPMHVYWRTAAPLPGPRSGRAEELAAADPVGWLDREWPLLRHAVTDSVARGFADVGWRLGTALVNFAQLSGRMPAGVELLEAVLGALPGADPAAEAAVLFGLAHLRLEDGPSTPTTRARLSRARRTFRRLGDPGGQGSAAVALGVAARRSGNLRLALAAHRHALGLAGRVAPHLLGYAWIGLGNVGRDAEWEPAESLRHYERALPLMRAGGDRHGEANALGCIGMVHRHMGRHAEAERALLRAAEVFDGFSDLVNLAFVQQALTEIYTELGDLDAADTYAVRALRTFERYGHDLGQGYVHRARGRLRLAGDRTGEAIEELRLSAEAFRRLDEPLGEAISLLSLTEAYERHGDPGAAGDCAHRARTLYAQVAPELADRVPPPG